MRFEKLEQPILSGLLSAIISILITFGYHLFVGASADIEWALVAVSFASFFSAFFALYDN